MSTTCHTPSCSRKRVGGSYYCGPCQRARRIPDAEMTREAHLCMLGWAEHSLKRERLARKRLPFQRLARKIKRRRHKSATHPSVRRWA